VPAILAAPTPTLVVDATKLHQLRDLLDERADRYNQPDFIAKDPISIPHRFSQLQDVEISALYQFITQHQDEDLKRLLKFCHRTFCDTDLLYFVHWLRWFYEGHHSLEDAFLHGATMRERLVNFHDLFFSLPDAPARTRKHVATPARGSACKRLNMYLRWLVRHDSNGVDFGLWQRISPAELICPIDVHVERQARLLGLLKRDKVDWQAAEELTANLRLLDPTDPVKYDFALFGEGVG
jgi:uncharacterized protein (TIGR02757 family)